MNQMLIELAEIHGIDHNAMISVAISEKYQRVFPNGALGGESDSR